MATVNFTGDRKHNSLKQLFCSEELNGGIHNQLICLMALNIFLSVSACMENTLIIVALRKESSLHPPSKLLFRCLAVTDLCVGLFVGPLVVIYCTSAFSQRWNICSYAFVSILVTGSCLVTVSLLTVTAISVDRLLALLLGLRYRQVVTLKRIYLALSGFWVLSVISSTMSFWQQVIIFWYGYIVKSLCVVTSIISYAKIFITLRHNQVHAQVHVDAGQQSQTITLNRARYKKTLSSALWVQLALVACYLPYNIVEILVLKTGLSPSLYLPRLFAGTLICLNSSLNPILYCWKIGEVRQAVKDTIRELCLSLSSLFLSFGTV